MAAQASSGNPEIFLNIRVQNKKGIVEQQVAERFGGDRHGPEGILTLAQRVANDFVSIERVGKEVAENVVKDLPGELRQHGIRATATLHFRRGCFFVVSVKVLAADHARLAAEGKVSRPVLGLLQCFQFLPGFFSDRFFAFVLQRVADGMLEELPGQVVTNLAVRGRVEASVIAAPAAQEASYLFKVLKDMDEEEAAEREKKADLGRAVQDFTGKDEYKFGDITKTLIKKARKTKKNAKSGKSPRS